MKKYLFAILVTTTALMGATSANAMTPKTLQYHCQSGKNINVTYHFNTQGIPTKAIAHLNGKNRVMPINLAKSDNVGTLFGKSGSYMLGAEAMNSGNYTEVDLSTITAPSGNILYKSCTPH